MKQVTYWAHDDDCKHTKFWNSEEAKGPWGMSQQGFVDMERRMCNCGYVAAGYLDSRPQQGVNLT